MRPATGSRCFHPRTGTCITQVSWCLGGSSKWTQHAVCRTPVQRQALTLCMPCQSPCTMQRKVLQAARTWKAPDLCNYPTFIMCARTWRRNGSFQLSLRLLTPARFRPLFCTKRASLWTSLSVLPHHYLIFCTSISYAEESSDKEVGSSLICLSSSFSDTVLMAVRKHRREYNS